MEARGKHAKVNKAMKGVEGESKAKAKKKTLAKGKIPTKGANKATKKLAKKKAAAAKVKKKAAADVKAKAKRKAGRAAKFAKKNPLASPSDVVKTEEGSVSPVEVIGPHTDTDHAIAAAQKKINLKVYGAKKLVKKGGKKNKK